MKNAKQRAHGPSASAFFNNDPSPPEAEICAPMILVGGIFIQPFPLSLSEWIAVSVTLRQNNAIVIYYERD